MVHACMNDILICLGNPHIIILRYLCYNMINHRENRVILEKSECLIMFRELKL